MILSLLRRSFIRHFPRTLLFLGLLLSTAAAARADDRLVFTFAGSVAAIAGPLAVGDFNADGKPDLAVADVGNDRVAVLAGNGYGGFGTPVWFAVGDGPRALVTADLNGDGHVDLATANETFFFPVPAGSVSVLLGNGQGAFAAAQAYTVGKRPMALARGDLNRDGVPDLVTANTYSSDVAVLLGVGDGTFAAAATYGSDFNPRSLKLVDVNSDGHLDAVVAAGDASGYVSVLLGSPDGVLGTPQSFAAGAYPMAVDGADFDGSGTLDLVFANDGSDSLTFLSGKGDGTFTAGETLTVGQFPRGVIATDLNRDGAADLIVIRQMNGGRGANTLEVFTGDGDGAFAAARSLFTASSFGIYAIYAVAADFNRDGKPDIALTSEADGKAYVYLGNRLAGDLNSDDRLDLADAVAALKVSAGMPPAGIYPGAAATAPGALGVAEAVYLLQAVAGLRPTP